MLRFLFDLFVLQIFIDKDVLIVGQYLFFGNFVDLFCFLYDNDFNIVVVINKLYDIFLVSI